MYFSSFPNYSTSTRPHRVSRLTFLIYSLDLLHKVTYIFWALTCIVALPSYTALISSFCTSSHDFDTHFLHFHLTVDSLCFSIWLAISTSITDLHRLAKRHACRTTKAPSSIDLELFIYSCIIAPVVSGFTISVSFTSLNINSKSVTWSDSIVLTTKPVSLSRYL